MWKVFVLLATTVLGRGLRPPPTAVPIRTDSPQRGVVLAGWFIAEPWITPSLFSPYAGLAPRPIDEFTLGQALGAAEARRVLQQHWETFIQKEDFLWMARHGINSCRIPVGYWAYDLNPGEPYVQGQVPYINQALEWAAEYGIKCIVDLAGVPESQNGFASSGHDNGLFWTNRTGALPKSTLTRFDINFGSYPYMVRTVEVVRSMVRAHTTNDTIDGLRGFGFVSDIPQGINTPLLNAFYVQARSAALSTLDLIDVPNSLTDRIRIYLGDAYRGNDWRRRWTSNSMPRSSMDMHIFHFLTPDALRRTPTQHIYEVCDHYPVLLAETTIPSIVGAFSLADTDCAPLINGVNDGHRILGTFGQFTDLIHSCGGDYSEDPTRWSPERWSFLRAFFRAQKYTWERFTQGWYFLNYKTEGATLWNFRKLVELGVIDMYPYTEWNPCQGMGL